MKRILVLVAFLAMPAFSNEVVPYSALENGQSNGLGVGGGDPWWGFMYRKNFANDLGVLTSIGGYFTRESGSLDLGANLLYTIRHHHFNFSSLPESSIRVNLLASLRGKYSTGKRYDKPAGASVDYTRYKEIDVGLGAGPGVEFFFDRHFSLFFELPWMTYVTIGKDVQFRSSYPRAAAGILYYL